MVVVLLASMLVFAGIRALPGSPADAFGTPSTPATFAFIQHKYLLDRPLPVQYAKWIWLALHGDLGVDERGLPVGHTIVGRIPVTLELAMLAIVFSTVLGVGAGVIAAWWQGRVPDYVVRLVALAGLSVPGFWVALVSIIVFAANLHWLPASGFVSLFSNPVQNLRHMILPSVVLALGLAAVLMRQTRSAMLDSLSADYIRTAFAKGLSPWRIAGSHALRNSLITTTTVIGLELGALLSGVAIIEQIFGISGFGQLTLQAVYDRDYPLMQGTVLVAATGYVVVNLLVDLAYSLLDPRVRVAGASQ